MAPGIEQDEESKRLARLLPGDGLNVLNPPSAVVRAAEVGVAWAESVGKRVCLKLPVADWPAWLPFDEAPTRGRDHAARLVAALHIHVSHPSRDPDANTPAALDRKHRSEMALTRVCYEAARARYLELAAWRFR